MGGTLCSCRSRWRKCSGSNIYIYILIYIWGVHCVAANQDGNNAVEHSNTTAHHPVVKPPAAASTAVSHTPTDTTGLGKLPGTIL